MAEDDARQIAGLIHASGLTLTDEEQEQLAQLYRRLARDRDALSAVPLGETEPAVTFSMRVERGIGEVDQ